MKRMQKWMYIYNYSEFKTATTMTKPIPISEEICRVTKQYTPTTGQTPLTNFSPPHNTFKNHILYTDGNCDRCCSIILWKSRSVSFLPTAMAVVNRNIRSVTSLYFTFQKWFFLSRRDYDQWTHFAGGGKDWWDTIGGLQTQWERSADDIRELVFSTLLAAEKTH